MSNKPSSSSDDLLPERKRKRPTGVNSIDDGIEANECIEFYMVSSKDEVDSPSRFQFVPIDLNAFFEDDGRIYGYQDLKITVWISSISFRAYADISFKSKLNRGKGITDLKTAFQSILADNLVEEKDDFLQTFSTECDYVKSVVSKAEVLPKNTANGCTGNSSYMKEEPADVEVFRVKGTEVGHLYCRLVPLVLLLIDGSNPIDITDPSWEIYLTVQKGQQDSSMKLLGFAAVYRFHKYPDSMRLRLGQILILPPYQRKGYGCTLLKVINNVAISDDIYDLTIEEPVKSLQHVRTCIDVQRLLAFEPIHEALGPIISQLRNNDPSKKSKAYRCGPPANIVEDVRKNLKINKRQFLQCWEVLIYVSLGAVKKHIENWKTVISNRVRADVIGKESEGAGKRLIDIPTQFDQRMSFAMFKTNGGESDMLMKDENQGNIEEELRKLVDERITEIKAVAKKLSVKNKAK
ncbi:hypothetical protein ACP275_10G103000 [Erythranthe tilingii]